MKRHGLWVFHMEAAHLRKISGGDVGNWWLGSDEMDRISRRVRFSRPYGVSYSDIIVKCIARYSAIYKIRMTAGHHNALVHLISKRTGWDNRNTIRAALITARDRCLLAISKCRTRMATRHFQCEVHSRRERLVLARRKRVDREKELERKKWLEILRAQDDIRAINSAIRSAKSALK